VRLSPDIDWELRRTVQATVQINYNNALTQHLSEQKSLCETVEKINLEQKLEQERSLNEALNLSLDAQYTAMSSRRKRLSSRRKRLSSKKKRWMHWRLAYSIR
jgi:hypothetical protein